jgi:Orsellinic acid/F9775 biosynthesis cluster protein D
MSGQDITRYITHITTLRIILCRFYETTIPPNDPLRHYELYHTRAKEHPVSMEDRHKVAEYMATLDLCAPDQVKTPSERIPGLKIIEKGWKCNFSECKACSTSELGIRKHYYSHRESIPINFKDWEQTAIQTIFEGKHRK